MSDVIFFLIGILALIFIVLYYIGIVIGIGRVVINLTPRFRNVRFADARWRSITPTLLRWLGGSFGRGIYLHSKTRRPGTKSNLRKIAATPFLFLLTFFAWFVLMVVGISFVDKYGFIGTLLSILMTFGSPFIVGYIFLKLTRRLRLLALKRRQLLAASASEALSAYSKPFILLLRSFRDDCLKVKLIDNGALPATLEKTLVDRLSRRGPVIAVGQPGENLPPLGASREYITDEWQLSVRQRISKAAIIVAILDKTDGLLWEIEQVFTLGRQGSLIIIVPDEELLELSQRWRATVGVASTNRTELSDRLMRLPMQNTLAIVFEKSGRGQRIICRNRLRGSYRDAIEFGIWFVNRQKAEPSTTPSDEKAPVPKTG